MHLMMLLDILLSKSKSNYQHPKQRQPDLRWALRAALFPAKKGTLKPLRRGSYQTNYGLNQTSLADKEKKR